MSKLRIVIGDDHTVLRSGLKMLLESQSDMEVVGEAYDTPSSMRVIQECLPDVMTVDLSMPGGDGFNLLHKLKVLSPNTRLVVLTMHDDPAYFRASVAAGADGFVLKKAADEELMTAIRTSMTGKFFSTVDLESDSPLNSGESAWGAAMQALEQLSEREREVLTWVAQGLTNQQVADKLFLSIKTVESYRSRLMNKLKLSSRSELVRFALNAGLMFSDPEANRDITLP